MSKRRSAAAPVSEAGTSASGTRATRAKVAHQQDVQTSIMTEITSERDAGIIHESVKNSKKQDYLSPVLAVPIYTSLVLDFLPPISTRFMLRRLCEKSQTASENRGFWSGLKGLETVSIQNAESLLQLISKTASSIPSSSPSIASSILSFISIAGSATSASAPTCTARTLKGLVRVDWSTLFLSSDAHITAALTLLGTGTDLKEVTLFNSVNHVTKANAASVKNFINGIALLPKSIQVLDLSASIPADEQILKQFIPVVASHLPHLTSLSLLASGAICSSTSLAPALERLPASLKALEIRMSLQKNDVSWAKPLASRGLKSLHIEGDSTRMEDETLLPGLALLTSLQELQLHDFWTKPQGVGWDLRCSLSGKFWRILVEHCPQVHTIILNNICNIKDPEINTAIFPSATSKGLTSLKKLHFINCSFIPVVAIIHDAIASSSPIEVLQFEGLHDDSVPAHVYTPPPTKASFMTVVKGFGDQIASDAVGMKRLKALTLRGRKLHKDEFSCLAKLFPRVQELSFDLDNEALNGAELLELSPLKQLRSLSLTLEGRFGMTQKDRNKRLPYTLATLLEPLFTQANFPALKELSLNLNRQRMVDEASILEVLSLFVKEESDSSGTAPEAASSSSSRRGRGKATSSVAVVPAAASSSSSVKACQAHPLNLVSLNLSSTIISDHAVVELTRHADLLNLRELYLHNCSCIESQTIDFVRARCRDCIVEFSPPPVRNYVYKKRDLSWIDR